MKTVICSGSLESGLKWEIVSSNKKSLPEGSGDHYILNFVDGSVNSLESKKALLAASFEIAEDLSSKYTKGRWRIETSGPKLARNNIFHIHIICPNEDFVVRRSVDSIAAK